MRIKKHGTCFTEENRTEGLKTYAKPLLKHQQPDP
jgi:hypothetical protein